MSKSLSLKLKDNIFVETEDVTEAMKISRNAYINEAVGFYNKLIKRKLLKKKLKKESQLVSSSSLEALSQLELLEDEILDDNS